MILDTGAVWSTITPEAAKAIGAEPIWGSQMKWTGANGDYPTTGVTSVNMTVGGLVVGEPQLAVAVLDDHVDGLLGEDILSQVNVALDLPHDHVMLYRRAVCSTAFPFTGTFDALVEATPAAYAQGVPMSQASPEIPFLLDGQRFNAVLDSGAGATVLSQKALTEANINPVANGGFVASLAVGGVKAQDRREEFASLSIGGEAFTNSWLDVSDRLDATGTDALIGEDYLQHHQVYISNDTSTVYLGMIVTK